MPVVSSIRRCRPDRAHTNVHTRDRWFRCQGFVAHGLHPELPCLMHVVPYSSGARGNSHRVSSRVRGLLIPRSRGPVSRVPPVPTNRTKSVLLRHEGDMQQRYGALSHIAGWYVWVRYVASAYIRIYLALWSLLITWWVSLVYYVSILTMKPCR